VCASQILSNKVLAIIFKSVDGLSHKTREADIVRDLWWCDHKVEKKWHDFVIMP